MEQVDRQYEFHRLARSSPQYRWWNPLLTALLGVAFYVVFIVALLLAGVVAAFATSADVGQYMDAAAAIDLSNPVIFAFTLISLILMIPALALASLIIGPRPIGLLSSVAGRIRWRWLAVCTVVALAVYVASLLVSALIGYFFPEEGTAATLQQDTSTLAILLALTLLAVPFQAAAEEYVFRGFLMQAIGSWLRHPAFAILLPVPLFVLAHGYDPLGQTYIAVFAVFAGWITWRTGGLEAAIAVHAVNNMSIFALGAFGLVDVNASEGSTGGLVVSVATMVVTAVVIVRLANRRGIDRTRTVAPAPALSSAPFPGGPAPTTGSPTGAYPASVPSGQGPWSRSGPQELVEDPAQAPVAMWPGAYDPSQYDPSRYAPRHQGNRAPAAAPRNAPTSTSRDSAGTPGAPPAAVPIHAPSPPPIAPPVRRAAPPAAPPVTRAAPPAAPPSAPPVTRATGPAGGYGTGSHPSGQAHPPGPGYPSGTSHPAGPGHPAAGPSADGGDRGHDEVYRQDEDRAQGGGNRRGE